MPEVSVIMPVYNARPYLDKSVGSVIAQTYADWELVCFDDASTDGSGAALDAFAAADARIRVIHSAVNVRQGAGRNRAIREARGRFIVFLDADDTLRPDSLQLLTDTARTRHADMVMFDYQTVPGTVRYPLGPDAWRMEGDALRRHFILHPSSVCWSMYTRQTLIDNDLFFREGVFYEDNAVALAMQLSHKNPVKVDAPLYNYYIYDASVSHRRDDYRFFHRLASAVTLKGHLQRLGLYDRWRDEIDFVLINQYYTHTVTGCVYRFDRVPVMRQRYVRRTIERVVPDFRHNRYYRAMPLKRRVKLELHARFPRAVHALWTLCRRLGVARG